MDLKISVWFGVHLISCLVLKVLGGFIISDFSVFSEFFWIIGRFMETA